MDSRSGRSNSAGGLNYLLRRRDASETCRVACTECFISPGWAAEQGEPYGPVVEQLSLEKE